MSANGNGKGLVALVLVSVLCGIAVAVSLLSVVAVYREVNRIETEMRDLRTEQSRSMSDHETRSDARHTNLDDYWKTNQRDLGQLKLRVEALETKEKP